MIKFEVGHQLPSQWQIQRGFEGAYFEALEDGFVILLCLFGITEKEKTILRKTKMAVRIIEQDDFLLTLVRFGSTPLIFEMSLDPTLYPDDRGVRLVQEVNTLQAIGVDSKNNTIQSLRFVSVPKTLLEKWRKNWKQARNTPCFSEKYNKFVDSLYARYSTVQLWDQGLHIGNLGEV